MSEPVNRFEELYAAHSLAILAYAARRTASGHDAADVMADTFVVAWRRIADVPAGDEALPWLYGVARGVLSNHRRGLRRRTQLSARLASQVAELVDDASRSVGGPDSARVSAALGALSDDDRELLLLIGWDGLSPQEAAVVLGCAAGTIRVRLHRARRRFDTQLRRVGVQRAAPDGHQEVGRAPARADLREV